MPVQATAPPKARLQHCNYRLMSIMGGFGGSLLAVCASALISSVSAVSSGFSAPLTCGVSGPSYAVSLDGSPLLGGAPSLRAFVDGVWREDFSLLRESSMVGHDALGSFEGADCTYALGAAPAADAPVFLTLSAYVYASAAASPSSSLVRFRYVLPNGAANTNHTAANLGGISTLLNYPAFTSVSPLSNLVTWQDSFVQPQKTIAFGQTGGPLLSYGADVAGRATLFSPMDNFLTSALGDEVDGSKRCSGHLSANACFAAGTAMTVKELPAGFSHSWLLVADTGITPTVNAWGAIMRAYYGVSSTKLTDMSLSTIGYQTDNGAQLCFGCPKQVLDECLLNEKAYLDSIKVPIQYLSFQNAWWQSGGESAPWCIGEWVPEANKVPMGMQAFQKAFGLPLQLYAPYFCATSAYPANFSMIPDTNRTSLRLGCRLIVDDRQAHRRVSGLGKLLGRRVVVGQLEAHV